MPIVKSLDYAENSILEGRIDGILASILNVGIDITNLTDRLDGVDISISDITDDITLLESSVNNLQNDLIPTITTTAISLTATATEKVFVSATGVTITLPLNPEDGTVVSVGVLGAVSDTIVARNGATIMGLAENITLDVLESTTTFFYVEALNDWRII